MDEALRPEMPVLDAEPIKVVEEQAVEISVQDDKELAALNMSRGWNRIRDAMKADIDQLRNMTGASLEGKDFAEVGQAFLVASLSADKLQHYLDMVDNATKAVVEDDKRRTARK